MKASSLFAAALLLASNVFSTPTPTKKSAPKRRAPPGFVYSEDGLFKLDGKPFFYAGTNAYWLSQLNSDDDIVATLKDIASHGLKVVRTWGFREVVGTAPSDPKTYTALWKDGKQTFNQPGLDRIKFILDTADSLGLKIQLSLTNNWAPTFPDNAGRPLGYYSNSYGGVDTYVQQLHPGGTHDLFYTDDNIQNQYESWIKNIVPQFANHSALFSWEPANDPRCKGALGFQTSGSCNPNTITRWTGKFAKIIKDLDPNHLTGSGDHGFFCVTPGCVKLNPLPNPAPATVTGGAAHLVGTKRSKRRHGWLTEADVLAARREERKNAAKQARKAGTGKTIRGSWTAPVASIKNWARQSGADSSVGAPYDGSQGVDTEDIAADPNIDFAGFQLFPDQNTYTSGAENDNPPPDGAGGKNFDTTLSSGLNWITQHAESAQTFNKPSALHAFGLVPQSSETNFTPFDSTNTGIGDTDPVATDEQQATAYTRWTKQATDSGINGITHYQWGKKGLKSQSGSVVDDGNTFGDSSSSSHSQGESPNDGYSSGASSGVQGILSIVASTQNGKDSS